MIDFQRLDLSQKAKYDQFLMNCGERGCEYSFANLNLWGRQKAAFVEGYLVLFSQFERRSVPPSPSARGTSSRCWMPSSMTPGPEASCAV